MFGRTARIALVLLATQLVGCFYCCERPFFWRKYYGGPGGGGCGCEPCTTCCGSPITPALGPPMAHGGLPIIMGGPATVPAAPAVSPQSDRMQPISSTALNSGLR